MPQKSTGAKAAKKPAGELKLSKGPKSAKSAKMVKSVEAGSAARCN